MPWDDKALTSDLSAALDAFDWRAAKAIVCDRLIPRIKSEPEMPDEKWARKLMGELRRKQQYLLMTQLAEAMYQSGVRTPQVRRQYAQALIDQGTLGAGELVLRDIIQDPNRQLDEEMEARGLTGRIYKQLYVNNKDSKSPANRANLERALNEYYHVYRLDSKEHLWHGINVVALAARARRDGFPQTGLPDEKELAREILKTLARREKAIARKNAAARKKAAAGEKVALEVFPAWDMATALEAYVALGEYEKAVAEASRYLFSQGADAFELGSTLRQLTEVWQLNEEDDPGNLLLPICKAGYLSKQGANHGVKNPEKIADEAAAAREAVKTLQSKGGFEKSFTSDAMVTLEWYRMGLETCDSVARVEKRNGTGVGTGWLVNAEDFFPDRKGVLLLTNEHVISDEDPHEKAIFPESARANFQSAGQIIEVDEIVYSNTYLDLDATFVTLKEEPKLKPLKIAKRAVRMAKPPPRLYVIGYPKSGDLKFSLQDNYLLGCNERLLHYRTPTEPGSSGSPVFEPDNWEVVALHHRGEGEMERIDGEEGTYEANEGIAIPIIQQVTRAKQGGGGS